MPNIYDEREEFAELVRKYVDVSHGKPCGGDDVMVKCPYPDHDDKNGSFSINSVTGVFHCFGCNKSGNIITLVQDLEGLKGYGNIDKFIKDFYNMPTGGPLPVAKPKKEILKEAVVEEPDRIIPKEMILDYIDNLNGPFAALKERMKSEWGVTDEAIAKLEIGADKGRVCFPVKNASGEYVNVRKYAFDADKNGLVKIMSYAEGYGKGRIWPIENATGPENEVLIVEGEKDCLNVISRGFNAVTGTVGAGTFKDEWGQLFSGKAVVIVYDNDGPGRSGAIRVEEVVKPYAESIQVVDISPVAKEDKEDITDYFVKYGQKSENLRRLIDSVAKKVVVREAPIIVDMTNPIRVQASEASSSIYFNRAIKVDCLIIGLGEIYMPTRKFKIECPHPDPENRRCQACSLSNGEMVVTYEPNNGKILNLINCTDAQILGWVKNDNHISSRCRVDITKMETFNIQEVVVAPKVNFAAYGKPVNLKCFFVGYSLAINANYTMVGYTTSEPKFNYSTQVFLEAIPDQASIKDFRLQGDDFESLSIFRAPPDKDNPMSIKSIEEKMADITKMFEYNITRIWGRDYVHHAIDLAYHSCLSFMFNGEKHVKGWMDVLIVGDPRTGKNNVMDRIMAYYGMGERSAAESMSYAGLIAGTDTRLGIVKLGLIPQNDGGLLSIDELSGLSTEIISQLSGVRDKGECMYNKLNNIKATGRTRLICLSNPRTITRAVRVKDHAYGVECIAPLVGNNEDIARFDYALVLGNTDVNTELINMLHDERYEEKYSSELCRKLVQWAWSRRIEDITIERTALETCMACAVRMSKIFSPSIPLVQSEDIRFKLAKIAVAYAARTFNTSDGINLIVESRHILMAEKFLVGIYGKPSMAYSSYSFVQSNATQLEYLPDLRALMEEMATVDRLHIFIKKMLATENESFTNREMQMILGEAELNNVTLTGGRVMSILYRCNAIIRAPGHSGHKKSPAFITFLKEYARKKQEEEGGGFESDYNVGYTESSS